MSGSALGIWALFILHFANYDVGRPLTKDSIRRDRKVRQQMKTCLLNSSPRYRNYCEMNSGALIKNPTNPKDIALRIMLSALLSLCVVFSLLTSTINMFLARTVTKGGPLATRLALGLSIAGWIALYGLYYAGFLSEATATALIFQSATVILLTAAVVFSSIRARIHRATDKNTVHQQKHNLAPFSSY